MVRKRNVEIFLETWHGTPLAKQRLAFDQEEVTAAHQHIKPSFIVKAGMIIWIV